MSHAFRDAPTVTIAEFDAFVAVQRDDSLWELVDGRIVCMTNPTVAHEIIAGNIGAPMNLALRHRQCRVYQGGVGLQQSEDSRGSYKPRPDIMVQCGPVDQRRNYVTNPLVVVEVLSPGNMDDDRGPKLQFYKAIPTLRHIALVYQDQRRVEHYRRVDVGWEIEVLTLDGDLLSFEAVDFTTNLAEVYRTITL